jgi:hypothetical protein
VSDEGVEVPSPSPAKAARSITEMVSAAEVEGGLSIRLFRRALLWALARASVGAREASRRERWAERASNYRLRASTLRPLAWTLVLEDDPSGAPSLLRAAHLILASLELRAELANPSCPPRRRAHAERLFGTTLVPGAEAFSVRRGRGRHVVVACEGGLWAVDVLDAGDQPRSAGAILADLSTCAAPASAPLSPFLALTARPRVEAAAAWPAIERASPEAAELLSEALFSVLLDGSSPTDTDTCGRAAQGGTTALRCFWHALQLVVFRNAKAAFVGSFVAGVEGEGALELAGHLGRASRAHPTTREEAKGAPPRRLDFALGADLRRALGAASQGTPTNAGGLLRVHGCGERAWSEAGVRSGAAVVIALRLALEEIVPGLDELECMVNVGHLQHGVVTRLGTSTPEMGALLRAAKADPADLGPTLGAAIAAHRARVVEAKRLENAEVALEFAFFALGRLPGWARWLLAALTRWVALLIARRAPQDGRADLHRPIVAIDSSVPNPAGVAAIGRFGVLAPPRSIWVHHSVGEGDVSFVLQLGPDHVALAGALREAIPRALDRVLVAARRRSSGAESAARFPAATRLAYRRLLGILAALTAAREPGAP